MKSRRSRLFATILMLMLPAAALQAATAIVATPTTVALTYQLGTGTGSGPGAAVPVKIGPSAGTTGSIYWTVNLATLPDWLVLDKSNGTATAASPTTVNFYASPLAASLGAGTFTASVGVQSAGLSDITIPVTLTVKNAPAVIIATLSTIPTWKPGDSLPANVKLSVRSAGDPQSFTITSSATNPSTAWFTLASTSGIAYSTWSTDISLTFSKFAFDNATIGKNLTGTITVKGTNNTVAVPVVIVVGLPTNITLTSAQPPKLPKVVSGTGTRTVSVTGTGFADGMVVKVGSGAAIANNCSTFNSATGNALCVQSGTRFFLKLTEATDLKPGTDIVVHVENQSLTIPVTTSPIVYSVTSSASFQQVETGNQTVAPYEIVTIFGDNFMKVGDSVSPTITNGRFPIKLTDNALDLAVHFTDSEGVALTSDSDAYLLFANSTQINVIVPSSLPAAASGGELKAVVSYGPNSSDGVTFNVAAAHPGIFTYVSTGDAIAVNADGTVNTSAHPATMAPDGTVLTLYVTGLGNPNDGKATPAAGSLVNPPDGCMDVSVLRSVYGPLWNTVWNTLDGGLVVPVPNTYAPCFDPGRIHVTIGGKDFTGAGIAYAGWVAGSVVGLYQVNVVLPVGATTGMVARATGAYDAKVSVDTWTFDTSDPPVLTVTAGTFSPTAVVYIR